MQAPSSMENEGIQMPSGQVLSPMNSYYYNYRHADNGTAGKHCSYPGQSYSAHQTSGSPHARQCSLSSGNFAYEYHWNAPVQTGKAATHHLPLDSTSTQRSFNLNGLRTDLFESRDQLVRCVPFVAQRRQTAKNRNQHQNGTLVPTTYNPQVLNMMQEKQAYFSSLTASSVPQRAMNNCFIGSNLERMVNSGQVGSGNSSFAHFPHSVEQNSTQHYLQWQNHMASGMTNSRCDTLGGWQRRLNSTKAVTSLSRPCPLQVQQVTASSSRLNMVNVGQAQSSQQMAVCIQSPGDGSPGTMNTVSHQNRSVCLNPSPEASGVSSQNIQAVQASYSAVPKAGGSNSLYQNMLQTYHSMDEVSGTNQIVTQSAGHETNQRCYVTTELPHQGSDSSLHSVKGNGGSDNLGVSISNHGHSLPLQAEAGQPPQNLINANGSSGVIRQHRDLVMSCPQPLVLQQPPSLQPMKCSGTAQSSLPHSNLGPPVCHTADHPPSSSDKTHNSNHPHAANGGCGQLPFTDQLLQFTAHLRSGLAARNKTFKGSKAPFCPLTTQESNWVISEQVAQSDCDKTFRELSHKNDSANHRALVLPAETHAKPDLMKLSKANNQPSMPTGTGIQKAVAVVPPISQQSNDVDQSNCTASAEGILGCKVQSVCALSNHSDGASGLSPTQREKNKVAIISLSDGTSCTEKPFHNLVPEIPAEVVLDKLSCLSNQQHPESAGQSVGNSSEMASSELNRSECETAASAHGTKGDQNVNMGENAFSLSTVPVTEWNLAMLRQLIATMEVYERTTVCKKSVINDIIGLFWGGDISKFSNALQMDLYNKIFGSWRVSPEERSPVVLTQLDHAFVKNVSRPCLILEHGAPFPNEPVYKSSWLNLDEQLGNIDKHHGFPVSLKFGAQMSSSKNEKYEVNGSEKNKVVNPVTKITNTDVQQTLSQVPPDPLSSIEIKVLPPEDAKKYFGSRVNENGLTGEFQNKELDQHPEEEDYQRDIYCCISRWIEVLNGQEKYSICRCQGQKNLSEKMETAANDKLVKKTETVQQVEGTKSDSHLTTVASDGIVKSGLNTVEIKVEDVHLDCKEVLEVEVSPSLQLKTVFPHNSEELHRPVSVSTNKSHNSGEAGEMETTDTAKSQILDVRDVPKCLGGSVWLSQRQIFQNRLSHKEKLERKKKIKRKEDKYSQKQKRTLQIKMPEQNLLRRTEGEEERNSLCPQSKCRLKDHHNASSQSVTKVQHKDKHKHFDSKVLSDVPKPIRNCGKGGVKNKLKKKISHKGTAESEGSTIVSLALYGSSPHPDHKINFLDKPSPPTTISLNIVPQNRNTLEENVFQKNSLAKQRVYSSWESSFIPQAINSKTKVLHSTQNDKDKMWRHKKSDGKQTEKQTNSGASSLKPHPPLKHMLAKAMDKPKDATNIYSLSKSVHKAGCTVPVKNSRAVLTRDHVMLQSSTKEKSQPLLKAKKRKLCQNRKNAHVSKRPHLQESKKCNPKASSKYKVGNPALMPLSVKDNVLEFKLLPKSFDFTEVENDTEKKPSNSYKKTTRPQELDKSTQRIKAATWKAKSPWCHNFQKKEAASDRLSIPSDATYEEYRRRYLARTKSEEDSLNMSPKDSNSR